MKNLTEFNGIYIDFSKVITITFHQKYIDNRDYATHTSMRINGDMYIIDKDIHRVKSEFNKLLQGGTNATP